MSSKVEDGKWSIPDTLAFSTCRFCILPPNVWGIIPAQEEGVLPSGYIYQIDIGSVLEKLIESRLPNKFVNYI